MIQNIKSLILQILIFLKKLERIFQKLYDI